MQLFGNKKHLGTWKAEWIEGARRGDRKSQKAIYDALSGKMYAICLRYMGDRDAAEDILQDVFCKAILSLPSGHVNARAWLYMVGRNLLLNELKKQRRQIYSEEPETRAEDRMNNSDGISGGNPEEQTIKEEESKLLRQALLSLDIRKREILILNYFEHFTLKEAAAIMGISYENARILSMRAKREIRRIMEVNGYEVS